MYSIVVDNISKKFNLAKSPNTLKGRLLNRNRTVKKSREYWALSNINFTISKGETVGIIGRNGSGKSTLLKLISRILYPTKGNIMIEGKVSSLLELGAGFKPDYTGVENIYLNGSILGFSKKEIEQKMDSIIEFSELNDFIDQPVRNYSSGMYMRLAYSIAVSASPDILLVDEILAVGDNKFKDKGINRILELKDAGTTIVLVSHSDSMIKKVCNRAIWLEKGSLIMDGETSDVLLKYNGNSDVGGKQ